MTDPTTRALYLGRVGVDVPLAMVRTWKAGASQVISGRIGYNSPAAAEEDAKTARQQLLGLLDNPDEPAIPVRYVVDSTLDGYYRVDDVSVTLDGTAEAPYDAGVWPFEISLTPVSQTALPITETTHQGTRRTGDLGAAVGTLPVIAFPGQATEPFIDAGASAAATTRTADDGLVRVGIGNLAAAAIWRSRASVPVAQWYQGGCRIEHGSPLRTIVGRKFAPATTGWRISNGLVRVSGGVGTSGPLAVSTFDGTNWDTPVNWTLASNNGSYPLGPVTAVTINCNSPECVSIRLTTNAGVVLGDEYRGRVYVDLTLNIGDRILYGILTSDWPQNWSLKRTTAEAGTAVTVTTAAVRATATDASGNRYIVMTWSTHTNDLTQGGFSVTGKSLMDFGLAAVVNAASPGTYDADTSLIGQYAWAGSQLRRLVAR